MTASASVRQGYANNYRNTSHGLISNFRCSNYEETNANINSATIKLPINVGVYFSTFSETPEKTEG